MKKSILFFAIAILTLSSCSKDEETVIPPVNNNTNTTASCGANLQDNKFYDGTKLHNFKSGAKTELFPAGFFSSTNTVNAAAAIDFPSQFLVAAAVNIQDTNLPTVNTTYTIGDHFKDASKATVTVTFFDENWVSNRGVPEGQVTIQVNSDGTYTFIADNIKLSNAFGTEYKNYCFKFTTGKCLSCN